MKKSAKAKRWNQRLHREDQRERDACALLCAVRKGGRPTHGTIKRTIEALARMGHRTGFVDGSGDGAGILTDIPRQLWARKIASMGLRSSIATQAGFWVAHAMVPASLRGEEDSILAALSETLNEAGFDVLYEARGEVNNTVLGPIARTNEPQFWQLAGLPGQVPLQQLDARLFRLRSLLEAKYGLHFASFSSNSVVYKVQGSVEILRRYYTELRQPDYDSIVAMVHARYSTNTQPRFERVQPFGLLGHNGEFNTISRFRLEAAMLGIDLDEANSDSQDVDRILEAFCVNYNIDLIEAMEYIFPPFEHDLIQNVPEIQRIYETMRQRFGPFAQGPASVAARLGDTCVFSVDALGLRPLWFGETEKEIFASSERGVYYVDSFVHSPRPLAPGEKVALKIEPGRGIEVLNYPDIQHHVLERERMRTVANVMRERQGHLARRDGRSVVYVGGFGMGMGGAALSSVTEKAEKTPAPPAAMAPELLEEYPWQLQPAPTHTVALAALGWERFHVSFLQDIGQARKEQIGSLGWDGPLAAMAETRMNLANYFKETVAVVTNPSIDREREQAQFSTRMLVGARPDFEAEKGEGPLLTLDSPLLPGGLEELGSEEAMHELAETFRTRTLEDLLMEFGSQARIFSLTAAADEAIPDALIRLREEAVTAVRAGCALLVLDDSEVYSGERLWLDPLLAVSAIDQALREAPDERNLRRRVGIVVRSGALRDLHDLVLCVALGATAVQPYQMYAVALGLSPRRPKILPDAAEKQDMMRLTLRVLREGMEKVISTIGCHELRGYGHSFSSIGLTDAVAAYFGTPNYFGSEERGLTWVQLQADTERRATELRGEERARLSNANRFYPKIWKKMEAVAHGELSLAEYTEQLMSLEDSMPVALRHIIGLREAETPLPPEEVDISIGGHRMPAVIGAMSFGSQGELAYRAYAEAAERGQFLCVNGEGGELPSVMGKYPANRGNQVASGRFGVNIEFLNSCHYLEIKIGQGAKPGEGGFLPGYKVNEQVALARHTNTKVDLISPSNNHDLYSIEDLAQLIEELKDANPLAKVIVKIPVVPGVGIISVGVAKAGADVITLTGYDGGTGAARMHALRYVGLPAEIGVWLAHHELRNSGLRDQVELWCDGGMKSGRDVVKMVCLGANRVGFATLAMVAMGCTICRKCQEGTCHVGITTHIKDKEEAAVRGLKNFEPRVYEQAVEGIVNVFEMLTDDIRLWAGKLGAANLQDLVGRVDLLEQTAQHERIDLRPLFEPAPANRRPFLRPGVGRRIMRPRYTLSRQITAIVSEHIARGESEITYDDEQVMAMDRALGVHLIGAIERGEISQPKPIDAIHLTFSNSAIPGNGLAAFLDTPLDVMVEGGAQDGVAKSARGGRLTILKGLNHNGSWLDGSVGKSFAYGAQGGTFIVQGDADTRACIRLSGADVIFGGEVQEPLRDELGGLSARANLKGYACEYMTSGRVLVLGDPGPWYCAGMTGGAVYQRLQPEMRLTRAAIRHRLAADGKVDIYPLEDEDVDAVQDMLELYIEALEDHNQGDAATHLYVLQANPRDHFIKIAPKIAPHG